MPETDHGKGEGAVAGVWRLLRSGAGPPALNLATDEALLASADGRPVLRLYAWDPPALSLGWFQERHALETDAPLAVLRRPTGGGAIHHEHELTFCIVAQPGRDGYPAGVVPAYRMVHAIVARALLACGAKVSLRGEAAPLARRPRDAGMCFLEPTALDLIDDRGRKVVGSAQRRRGARVLHHGSIPLSVASLTPQTGSASLAAGRPVSWDELADALVAAFAGETGAVWQISELSREEREAAVALAADRYVDLAQCGRRGSA